MVHVPQPPRSLTLHTESQLAAAPEEAEAEQEAKPVAELGSQQSNKLVRHFSCDRPERRKSFDAELEPEPEPEPDPEQEPETKLSTKLKRLQSMDRPKNALTRQKSYDRASDQIQVRPHQLQFPIICSPSSRSARPGHLQTRMALTGREREEHENRVSQAHRCDITRTFCPISPKITHRCGWPAAPRCGWA